MQFVNCFLIKPVRRYILLPSLRLDILCKAMSSLQCVLVSVIGYTQVINMKWPKNFDIKEIIFQLPKQSWKCVFENENPNDVNAF